ncbi:chemotaxis protein CheW [Seleniivibrio woodruffii]|uniref:Chemotaxis signal transduction protein n=1 Tax=Seleniivibrio woodruffii TaxID=1078050 RepID=A0A4R1K567_9BACT|nr:chemotaxis protein CheW [Seleniivibrio woodruffii]TCK59316.1 chemotaxis signal transduction protein [Seleniivibrio woodruffii]TVZ35645.1 chemotaxis signal transduction protein [Seleniivibrio woodruffii]
MSNLQPVRDLEYGDVNHSDDLEVIQLVGLKLGEEEYAIDVLKIQEIIRTVDITSVPRTDSFVLGVMNLRGKVIPVIDLRVRFSLDKMDFDKETRIIVVKFETENIGFVVDEVTEVIRINKKMVEPTPPLVGSVGQEYILGICKYADRLIILLDIDSVIADGKTVLDSNLKKSLLGQPALPSQESNFNKVAAAVEKEFESKENYSPAAIEADEDIFEESDEEAPAGDLSIDDLIALELNKREQETDELNKKKEEGKKKPEIVQDSMDDILNDALNQSENSMQSTTGHVEQDELDFLIQQELTKREKETEELNKKKNLADMTGQACEVKPAQVPSIELSEDDIDKLMEAELAAQELAEKKSSKISVKDEMIEEPAAEEISAGDGQFDIPEDLAAEFGLDDISLPEEAQEEEFTLPEPIEQEMGDEIIGKGIADKFTEDEELVDSVDDLLEQLKDIPSEPVAVDSVQAMKTAASPFNEQESFEKLKTLSKKIIDGEKVDLGISIKQEVSELLRLILDTKGRVDEIEPTLITSREQIPTLVKSLENVTESTEEATLGLMEAADGLTGHYQEFLDEIEDLEDLMYKKDQAAILKKLEALENSAAMADTMGMNILHSLEFQDITEQKLRKVINAVREIGGRLGAILGFIKLKQEVDPTTVEDASQDDIDKLLAEFGLN